MKHLAALSLLALAACGPTRQELQVQDQTRCAGYGLRYGTPEFAQCMMLLDQQRSANAGAANAQLLGVGMYLNQQSQPYVLQPPGITPFTCQTYGNQTSCR